MRVFTQDTRLRSIEDETPGQKFGEELVQVIALCWAAYIESRRLSLRTWAKN